MPPRLYVEAEVEGFGERGEAFRPQWSRLPAVEVKGSGCRGEEL